VSVFNRELEERLHELSATFKEGVQPPATLHVSVMTRTAARPMRRRATPAREIALAAALVAFVAVVAFGFSKLHTITRAPIKPSPHPTASAIPWTPAAMVLSSASAQQGTPSDAATWIGHTVATLDPVLLPSVIGEDYQAQFMADQTSFSVQYASATRHASNELASSQPVMPPPGSHGRRSAQPFRGVTATYQVDSDAPTASRWLFWNERGVGQDIAYSLIADGLSDGDFWQVANSIQPLPSLTTVRACAAGDLRAAAGRGGAATGGLIFNMIYFSNHSDTSCVLNGTPQVLVKTSSGRTLPLPQMNMPVPWLPSSPIPALMSAHSPDPQLQYGRSNSFGQASLMFALWDCPTNPSLTVLTIVLPSGRGTISLPANDIALSGGGECEGGNIVQRIEVSPFAGTAPQPTYVERSPLSVTIKLPDHVRAAQTLRYQVVLTNASASPFRFDDCPSYTEDASRVGSKNVASYQLNCSGVGWLAPDASVAFAMVLEIPASAPPGSGGMRWRMGSAYGVAEGSAALTVTAS
jgi:hypothetical protein